MAINPLNNSLIVLQNPQVRGQKPVPRDDRPVVEQFQPSDSTNSRAKVNSFKSRVGNGANFRQDVVFSSAEKSSNNPSVNQYLTTENIAKRDAIQSLVGLDVYV